ncbi:hypothetical protein JCM11641_005953 [Rhodosporidiobolus odoratus]
MVKITSSSLLVGAALVASSAPALAAPTRFAARSTAEVAVQSGDIDTPQAEDIDAAKESTLDTVDDLSRRSSVESLKKRDTNTDRIRRGVPISPNSAEELAKRADIVTSLGLDGTLAPLGLGDLVPTLTGAISGLPIVGEPVGGLVKTVDGTVGVTSLLQPKKAAGAAKPKRDLFSSLTGSLGGTMGSLPLVGGASSGLLNSAGGTLSSTINSTPLGGVLGQVQGNSQLQTLLGQLNALGLGNLPLSQLSQLASAGSGAAGSVLSNTPVGNAADAGVPSSLMSQLSVAQAEQLGLLAAGTAQHLLATVQAEVANAPAGSALANTFKVSPHGFKASGNETDSSAPPANSTATIPTFPIAPPEAVASAIAQLPSSAAPAATTDGAKSFAASTAADDDADAADSGSEYSDDESGEDETDDELEHEAGLEGQGPNASGAGTWNTASSAGMTSGPSQGTATATAEAMSLSYSEASATSAPTSTGNAKRWAVQLD